MPTYDYRCQACGHQLEVFQSITAKPLEQCPNCSKMTLKRGVGGGCAIQFKGNGFYLTDYGKGGHKHDSSCGCKNKQKEAE